MTLKQLIRFASQAYDPHDPNLVMWYYEEPKGNFGDGLARFIAVEIAETYDPKATTTAQLAEARRVIEQGARQLEAVATALLKKEMADEGIGRAQRRRACHRGR